MENFSDALSDFQQAADLQPGHFETVQMINYLLAREHRCDEIIEYRSRFLEMHPDRGDTYFEWAGTATTGGI